MTAGQAEQPLFQMRLLTKALADQTPAFVYDISVIERKIAQLTASLPFVTLYFALKANPLPPLLARISDMGIGAEVASRGELNLALNAGFLPSRVVFGGPGKTKQDVEFAISSSIHALHCESIEELEHAIRARGRARVPLIAARLNPSESVIPTIENMTGGSSRFGIDEEEFIKWMRGAPETSYRLDGLHLYQASQVRDWATIAGGVSHMDSLIAELPDWHPNYRNYGGGLGVPMGPSDGALDLTALSKWWQRNRQSTGELALEPGRFIVAEAGALFLRVVRVKHSRGRRYVITDGGMNCFLRPVLTGEVHSVSAMGKPVSSDDQLATVTGALCSPLDTFGEHKLPPVVEGDLLKLCVAGAYGPSLSPVTFLGHPTPSEWIIDDGDLQLIRRQRTANEYLYDGLI